LDRIGQASQAEKMEEDSQSGYFSMQNNGKKKARDWK